MWCFLFIHKSANRFHDWSPAQMTITLRTDIILGRVQSVATFQTCHMSTWVEYLTFRPLHTNIAYTNDTILRDLAGIHILLEFLHDNRTSNRSVLRGFFHNHVLLLDPFLLSFLVSFLVAFLLFSCIPSIDQTWNSFLLLVIIGSMSLSLADWRILNWFRSWSLVANIVSIYPNISKYIKMCLPDTNMGDIFEWWAWSWSWFFFSLGWRWTK